MLASCSVYWNCVRDSAAADRDVLRRLQEQPRALHLVELRAQPRDDLVARWRRARSRGFSVMYMRPLFSALPPPPIAIATLATSGSACTIFADLLLNAHHLGEGNVLRRFGNAR